MAENLETLAIKIDLDSNPVIKALNQIAETFNKISSQARDAGTASDKAFDSGRVQQTADAIGGVSANADKATASLQETARAGFETGVQVDRGSRQAQQSLQQLDRYANQLFRRLRRYVAPFALIGMGKKMFSGFISEAIALEDVAKKAKMGITELDAWRRANTACGGSADALTKAIEDWTAKTGKGGDEFLRLGQQLNGMTEKQQDAHLKLLGLTRESASVFLMENKEMQELVARYRETSLTPQDAENARKTRMQWAQTKVELQALRNEISRLLMPTIKGMVKGFLEGAKFISQHATLVKIALTGVAVAANLAFGKKSALALASFIKSPMGIALASIVAFSFVLEDVIYFTNEENSALELMMRNIGMTDDEISNIRQSFKDMAKQLQELADMCAPAVKELLKIGSKELANDIEALAYLISLLVTGINALTSESEGASKAFTDLGERFPQMMTKIMSFLGGLPGKFISKIIEAITSNAKNITDKLTAPFKNAFSEIWQLFIDYVWNPLMGKLESGWKSVKGFFGFGDDKNTNAPAVNPNAGDVMSKVVQNTTVNNAAKIDNKYQIDIRGTTSLADDITNGVRRADRWGIKATGDMLSAVYGGNPKSP